MADRVVAVNAVEEGPVQILHEGEDYTIRERGHSLVLEWKEGRAPSFQTFRLVENALTGVAYGGNGGHRFAERDAWYQLRLRMLRDLGELMQEDARVRKEEERQQTIDGLVSVLFRVPTLRLQLTLSELDLAGGKFSPGIEVKGVQCCRFPYSVESDHVELTLVTDLLGAVTVELWGAISDCARQTHALTLHTDPSCVPERTSLKYLAMRRIATDILARRTDTAFLDATFKSLWRGFYTPPPPPMDSDTTKKRTRLEEEEGEGDEEEEPEQKRARVDTRE
jgi:hypothetical protein